MQHNPTAHAEIVAIRKLCAKLNTTVLKGYTIYERQLARAGEPGIREHFATSLNG